MSIFSERYQYTRTNVVIEDAPEWLRVLFIEKIYKYFSSGCSNDIDLNLETTLDKGDLPEYGIINPDALFHLIRSRLQNDFTGDPTDIILNCEWHEFFSIIEVIGEYIQYLNNKKSLTLFPDLENAGQIECEEYEIDYREFELDFFSYEIYQQKVNKLFNNYHVRWQLEEDGKLKRKMPELLDNKLESIAEELKIPFAPAYTHLNKAIKYSTSVPLDNENTVKEIVSALESLGRTLFPSAQTLTGVVKELRKKDTFPTKLLDVIQTFYSYASDEPGVRHGKSEKSNVKLEDAEFCLHLGSALIHYLVLKNGYDAKY